MSSRKCPVCQVFIYNEVVKFAYGKPGTRDRLYARVCQYVTEPRADGCINRPCDYGEFKPAATDYYSEPPEIKF